VTHSGSTAADLPGEDSFWRPRAGWRHTLTKVYHGIGDDRILSTAAGVSFYMLLAIFPGLAGLISLYGLFADSHTVSAHLNDLKGLLPEGGLQLLQGQLDHLTAQPSQKLGFATLTGLLVSLWSANGGIKAMFDALNVAYEKKEARGFLALNLLSLALTLGALGFMIASLLTITIMPRLLTFFGMADASLLVNLLRWPVLFLVASLSIALLYRVGPSRKQPHWRWISPGSVTAAVMWFAASLSFSWYAEHFGTYDQTYGSLGAAVGLMTWVWLSAIVILLGAELDAELERQGTPTQVAR